MSSKEFYYLIIQLIYQVIYNFFENRRLAKLEKLSHIEDLKSRFSQLPASNDNDTQATCEYR